MTVAVDPVGRGFLTIDITGVASTDAAGIGEVLNPEGVDVTILRAYLVCTTASTGAANLSMGIAATGVSASDLWSAGAINGITEGAVFNCFAPQATAKTELTAPVDWDSDKYITFTGSATTAGFTGKLCLEYIRQS